jgi:hypothetical protein
MSRRLSSSITRRNGSSTRRRDRGSVLAKERNSQSFAPGVSSGKPRRRPDLPLQKAEPGLVTREEGYATAE